MRKLGLSAVILLTLIAAATAVVWAKGSRPATASFTPPAEPGQIFTVIDYPRAQGRAQTAMVTVAVGDSNRSIIAPAPAYQNPCTTSTPAGIVLKLRHNTPDTTPYIFTTNGAIVRPPYQGDPPLELLHTCYKLVK